MVRADRPAAGPEATREVPPELLIAGITRPAGGYQGRAFTVTILTNLLDTSRQTRKYPHFPGVSAYTEERTRKWVRVSNQSNVRSSSSCIVWQRWFRVTASCSRHHTRSMGLVSGEYFGR